MAKPRQSSFRRILVSRILVLSVPVLLTGEFVAFKKARSSMLETAHKNLTESAILKAERVTDTIATLKSNLNSASQTTAVRSGNPVEVQAFIDNLAMEQRQQVECIQVIDMQDIRPIASTCGDDVVLPQGVDEAIADHQMEFSNRKVVNLREIQTQVVVPPKVVTNSLAEDGVPTKNQLQFLISAPVYDVYGKLAYLLSVRAQLQQKVKQSPNLLTGYTLVITENGQILTHPLSERVGQNIREHVDGKRLQEIVQSAIAGKRDYLHFFFDREGEELIAGYTAISSPVTTKPDHRNQKWIVLDVTSLDSALYGLREIKVILVVLTFGLIGASVIASLYLARHVSQPLEELCNYALQIGTKQQIQTKLCRFRIREFNQLASAFDLMTERLNIWAEEIESAWKDAKNANQLKSNFIANTSHEIRNPLNVIINSIQVVKDDLCDSREEELEYLGNANNAAIHLLNLINDLLDLSRIEAGKLSVNLEIADLCEVIKETINLQSVNIQSKGLKFNVPPLTEQITVKIDRGKLKQVLINVISNATKFTDQGSISLAVTTASTMEDGREADQVMITVKDTGIGIEPTQQQQLFRPFVMIEDSANSRFKGTGLGLAISRNLIEMMGGKISLLSSGINQGTTVTITLPLLAEDMPNPESEIIAKSPVNNLSPPGHLVSK